MLFILLYHVSYSRYMQIKCVHENFEKIKKEKRERKEKRDSEKKKKNQIVVDEKDVAY